jgi:D-glycero-D-manno-heptose 1,7-bisphosphate phosphatase
MGSNLNRAIFLDRDGTLNEDSGYFHEAEKLIVFPEVPEALFSLKNAGFLLIVVTNQGAIAQGLYPQSDVEAVHQALQEYLGPYNVQIDDFFFCPHREDEGCECRKPRPGMLYAARDKYAIDLKASFLIGDKLSDLDAGRAAGCTTCLVLTGHGQEFYAKIQALKLNVADIVARNMRQAAREILKISMQY